jgi:hypothetical protein
MPEVFDSLEKIQTRFGGAPFLEGNPRRKKALAAYFSKRGVVQLEVDEKKKGWPSLVYPTPDKLKAQVGEWEGKHKDHAAKKWQWQVTHLQASSNETVAHAKKVVDPLYWKHIFHSVTDSEYRADAQQMNFHPSILTDEKYRPMMQAFVDNPDYRKQLSETVKTSPVYQNHKGLANQAREKRKLKMEVSKSLIDKTNIHVKESQDQLFMFKELLRWSEEK